MKNIKTQYEIESKEALRTLFFKASKVDDEQLSILINSFQLVSYKKNHQVIKEGELPEYFYFIF